MLSPADYAAYSQATGRPYPQSDEEKANMYGEVRDFRNGQTKSDQGPGLAGGLAIGAAVLGWRCRCRCTWKKTVSQFQEGSKPCST